MRPVLHRSKRKRVIVEIEDAFPDDRAKRITLHFCGPEVQFAEPGEKRWRIGWMPCAPMLHLRGVLFGVHFLVEVSNGY